MSKQILSARPDGPLFKDVAITVVRIDPMEFVPDYSEDGPTAVDRALVEFQAAMFGKDEQDLSMVRDWLDLGSWARFVMVGLRRRRRSKGTFSDFALAVVVVHPGSPFGIEYRVKPSKACPEGMTLVSYRGHTYERHSDTLVLCKDAD